MKKSYHSIVVPMIVANATRRWVAELPTAVEKAIAVPRRSAGDAVPP
jgi:hypothetical protein